MYGVRKELDVAVTRAENFNPRVSIDDYMPAL